MTQALVGDDFIGPLYVAPAIPQTPSQKMACAWGSVLDALDASDLPGASTKIDALRDLQRELGYESAEQWSLELVRRGEEALVQGDSRNAVVLLGWAEKISPSSVPVALSSARIAHLTGFRGLLSQVFRAAMAANHDRLFVLSLVVAGLYPALLAITIALFLLVMLSLGYWMQFPLRFMALKLPNSIRGILSPLLVLGVLVAPLLLGPLWTLTVWSVMVLLVMPERRWLAFYSALIIGAWAGVTPIREALKISLEDPRVGAYVRASSGIFERGDGALLSSFLKEYPTSPGVQYAKGVTSRREGRLDEADEAFGRAELLWRSAGSEWLAYALAQRGVISFLKDDYAAAKHRFSEAQSLGLSTPAFALNRSKLAFAETDTLASRSLFTEAEGANPELAAEIRDREDHFGDKHPLAIAEMPLPFMAGLSSILIPFADISTRANEIVGTLMPGMQPPLMGAVVIFLLLGFFARSEKPRRHRKQLLYPQPSRSVPLRLLIRVVPGGSLLTVGRTGTALLLLSLCLLLAMPLIGWPGETIGVLSQLPDFKPYFVSFVVLLSLGSVYVSWHLVTGED